MVSKTGKGFSRNVKKEKMILKILKQQLIRTFNPNQSEDNEIIAKSKCEHADTGFDPKFFVFVENAKASIINYNDKPRCLILSLSDAQKRIFWRIAIECINRNSHRTGPIQIKGFFEGLTISTPVVRTSLNRLVDKGVLQRETGKPGKNGFSIISLPKAMFNSSREIWADFKARA